jgi:hypothetical protein
MIPSHGSDDQRLDALFVAFRQACPDRDASANFMPGLWQKIDARKRVSFSLGRMASAFVTAALAFSLMIGMYMARPGNTSYFAQNYVEALNEDHGAEQTADLYEPVRLEAQ